MNKIAITLISLVVLAGCGNPNKIHLRLNSLDIIDNKKFMEKYDRCSWSVDYQEMTGRDFADCLQSAYNKSMLVDGDKQ
jgi:hypothetical protein